MNTLISQLKKLAMSSTEVEVLDETKFAKLIINECLLVASLVEYQDDADPLYEVQEALKAHFGFTK